MSELHSSRTIFVVRNEVDASANFHCEALVSLLPDPIEIDLPTGERFDLGEADAVVLTGSTAGVYEADEHPWMYEEMELIRTLVDRRIPTLGVCFGHQLVNAALGGSVEQIGLTATLLEAELEDIALFDGVSPVLPTVHEDAVVTRGDEMDVIATAPHNPVFATRHQQAPLWTVQFHPEFDATHRDELIGSFGWESDTYSFSDVSSKVLFDNFLALVDNHPVPSHPG